MPSEVFGFKQKQAYYGATSTNIFFMMARAMVLLFLLVSFWKPATSQFVYTNPLPGSSGHHPEVTIALNPGYDVDERSLYQDNLFTVTGSVSGSHSCRIVLSSDGHTIMLIPEVPFQYYDRVTVQVGAGIRLVNGRVLQPAEFSFGIRGERTEEQKRLVEQARRNSITDLFTNPSGNPTSKIMDFPSFEVTVNDNPAPGAFFVTDKNSFIQGEAYLAIMNNDLTFDAQIPNEFYPNDWKMNEDCQFSYFQESTKFWYVMDTQFNVIDSLRAGNGYEEGTNGHELRLYPNGIKYIIAYDDSIMDLSDIGGEESAVVWGFILQRMDEDNNVVFEWRSWDYFEISDAVSTYPLILSEVDYCHGNSVDEMADGNILLSFRHLCEITKIDGTTGQFIWRLGGENNMFTFVDDITPKKFGYQHYARELPNGNILLFNNGKFQTPQESSAKEYFIDPVGLTATLKWSYVHPEISGNKVYGSAGGSAQRLPNGNTVICWGLISEIGDSPNFTEVDSAGNIRFDFYFDDPKQYFYRVTKHQWKTCDGIPTGVSSSVKHDIQMNLWPNPAQDVVSLSLNGLNGKVSLRIENILGEPLLEREVETGHSGEISLPLNGFASGIYLCTAQSGSQKLISKFIVQ